MYRTVKKITAINGDAWSAPASTINAMWAAISEGANALKLTVFFTRDGYPVCTPHSNLLESCGIDKDVGELDLAQMQTYDAGATYRSRNLDENYQPTGELGDDFPWAKKESDKEKRLKARAALFHPSLKQVLELFGRRTEILVQIADGTKLTADSELQTLLDLLETFGLQRSVTFCGSTSRMQTLKNLAPQVKCSVIFSGLIALSDLEVCVQRGFESITVNFDSLADIPATERQKLFAYANESGLYWRFFSERMPFAPTQTAITTLDAYDILIESWETSGALACCEALSPRATVFQESFAGTELNLGYWSAGYSHINEETSIRVDDKLIIDISEGEAYSGGAAICTLPIRDAFDVQVDFHVSNPHQATTFELAAIGIDPGYHHIDNTDLNTRTVNLTFDVHGAPPYASSERDQNDGFRCGWNNSYNFAKFGGSGGDTSLWSKLLNLVTPKPSTDWEAASSNMYNKYGRDVGDGSETSHSGTLRLIRSGALLSSYYRDKHNSEWVCSGTMLVQSLPRDAYLRLAAKHWGKLRPAPAPANVVSFSNFVIKQPTVVVG